MGRDWRGWRAVKRGICAATTPQPRLFSSLLFFALLFDTRVCQLLFHSSPFVSRPWSVFKVDTLRSAPVEKRMQPCCARIEKTDASCCFERERETLIFVNRRAWPGLEKNLSACIFYPFSSPLYGQRFFCFQRFKPSFQSVVICRQGRGCCCILRGLGKGVCWMECLRPSGRKRWFCSSGSFSCARMHFSFGEYTEL